MEYNQAMKIFSDDVKGYLKLPTSKFQVVHAISTESEFFKPICDQLGIPYPTNFELVICHIVG